MMGKRSALHLGRHRRLSRIWLAAQFKRLRAIRTRGPRSDTSGRFQVGDVEAEGARRRSDADLMGPGSSSSYDGLACDSPDAAVDLPLMWDSLEKMLATPQLSSKLDSPLVAAAVPIALKEPACVPLQELTATSLLLEEAATQATVGAARHSPINIAPHFIIHSGVRIQDGPNGRGLFATRDLPAGCTVLIEKASVAMLDVERERDGRPWTELSAADTAALACRVAAELTAAEADFKSGAHLETGKLLRLMRPLHPKDGTEIPPPPVRSRSGHADMDEGEEEEEDADLEEQMKADVDAAFAKAVGNNVKLKDRLEAVVRLNGLGYYTNSEQVCYTENYKQLAGTALCLVGSALNHSCSPNVGRFSVGDVLFFRTNSLVAAGTELCISYIESELLCEPCRHRREALDRDFVCMCSKCSLEGDAAEACGKGGAVGNEEKTYFSVDEELHGELAVMPPEQRIEFCRSLLRGEVPAEAGGGSDSEVEGGGKVELLLKDAQEIRTVLGLALTKIGRLTDAWEVWVEAAKLAAGKCPAFDEAVYAYSLQAALAAAASGAQAADWPVQHLRVAAALHCVTFGGDISFFMRRCKKEIDLSVGLTPGNNARSRQRQLLERLPEANTAELQSSSWAALRDQILSWKLPSTTAASSKKSKTAMSGDEPKKKKVKSGLANQNHQAPKAKAVVVGGMRVLP